MDSSLGGLRGIAGTELDLRLWQCGMRSQATIMGTGLRPKVST